MSSNVHSVTDGTDGRDDSMGNVSNDLSSDSKKHLDKSDIARYSRQLILPEYGVRGQLALCNAAVLVVGCGGLGCPVAIYLAGAGVGRIGLVDHDVVELSNLHRQVQHSEAAAVGAVPKAVSLAESCTRLNSQVVCDTHCTVLNSSNALPIVSQYDVIVDATDNVATRYLLNDACVLTGRPLVSGSALRFEGQLTVYNYKGSPCYRCLFPTPPPPEMVTNCSDGGVFGPVVGVIGTMQAVEAMKIVAGIGDCCAGRLVLYDGLEGTTRTVRLRNKRKDCAVCGEEPTVKHLIDYEGFCGSSATDKNQGINILSKSERITASEYAHIVEQHVPHFLVDVRTPVELEICKLPSTTHNIPMSEFDKMDGYAALLSKLKQDVANQTADGCTVNVFVVCRRGNDSQLAVEKLKSKFSDVPVMIQDIMGGLYAWSNHVDPDFPKY
jgi:adenylyltransferase and sulfurtransferase